MIMLNNAPGHMTGQRAVPKTNDVPYTMPRGADVLYHKSEDARKFPTGPCLLLSLLDQEYL